MRANVRLVVDQINKCAPILSERIRSGAVKVVGARYDLDTGIVETLK